MKKNNDSGTVRFEMVRQRHYDSLEKALETGLLDEKIQYLGFRLRTKGKCFTSSSCSGRIVILQQFSEKKGESYFFRKWHRIVDFDEVWNAINLNEEGEFIFKQEAFILHLCVHTLKDAIKLLEAKNLAGLKRGGIITIKDGLFIAEFLGSQSLTIPIKLEGKILMKKENFEKIVNRANEKLKVNFASLDRISKEILKIFG